MATSWPGLLLILQGHECTHAHEYLNKVEDCIKGPVQQKSSDLVKRLVFNIVDIEEPPCKILVLKYGWKRADIASFLCLTGSL